MQAYYYQQYGGVSNLKLGQFPKPAPKKKEVLIEVKAVALNASDWEFLTGKPLYTRAWGVFRPKVQILGSDVAGQVVQVGEEVRQFKAGDKVFGDIMGKWGGLSQYVCVPESMLHLKPPSLSFIEAACLPQSAAIALQGIWNQLLVRKNSSVLINGAGGGSGLLAIQLAKLKGARVSAVDLGHKKEAMEKAGADICIDYRSQNITQEKDKYHLILDLAASHSMNQYKKILHKGGCYLMVGGPVSRILEVLSWGSMLSLAGSKKLKLLGIKPNRGFETLLDLLQSGKLKLFVDKLFDFEDVVEAFGHLGSQKACGKIVVNVSGGNEQ